MLLSAGTGNPTELNTNQVCTYILTKNKYVEQNMKQGYIFWILRGADKNPILRLYGCTIDLASD